MFSLKACRELVRRAQLPTVPPLVTVPIASLQAAVVIALKSAAARNPTHSVQCGSTGPLRVDVQTTNNDFSVTVWAVDREMRQGHINVLQFTVSSVEVNYFPAPYGPDHTGTHDDLERLLKDACSKAQSWQLYHS